MVVQVIESSLIVPSEETPRRKLCLSNLEQAAQSSYTCSIYFYKNYNESARDDHLFFSVEVLKAAFAKALVLFYPLAGRLVVADDGRRMIDCNAEGALFVVARSERSSDEIDFVPSPELRNQFAPKAESLSLLIMLQVTYLRCGGVVLGSANNHIFDGRSAYHFYQTWARIARGETNYSIVPPPSFDNTRLRPRSPPTITFDYPEYQSDYQITKNPMTSSNSHVTAKLNLSNEQIRFLKSRCVEGSNTTRISTFCTVSALFWKCYCIAQELPPGTVTKLQFTADVRARVHPPLPQNFFGNAVIRTSAIAQVSEVISNSIHVAADAVKAAIDRITDEYVRSFIDYVEVNLHRKLKLSPVKELPKSGLRIANITGMPVYEANFGWGAPQLLTYGEGIGTNVICLVNEPGGAGVAAYVLLDSDTAMHKFRKACYEELRLLHNRL